MKIVLFAIFALAMNLNLSACKKSNTVEDPPTENIENMKLKISVGDTVITATLYDNATARDFISLLPLTLQLEDYAGTEKISYLSRKLSTKGAPSGTDPDVGDLTYYAPWGNLALFYRDFRYSDGLIKLGKLDSGTNIFNVSGSVTVKMELIRE